MSASFVISITIMFICGLYLLSLGIGKLVAAQVVRHLQQK